MGGVVCMSKGEGVVRFQLSVLGYQFEAKRSEQIFHLR